MIQNLRMRDVKQHNTHRERERERERERKREIGTKRRYIPIATVTNNNNNLKGYKVTLYSDSFRTTALNAIYRNSPNLGCLKGQCEYGHYTLVFDTPL